MNAKKMNRLGAVLAIVISFIFGIFYQVIVFKTSSQLLIMNGYIIPLMISFILGAFFYFYELQSKISSFLEARFRVRAKRLIIKHYALGLTKTQHKHLQNSNSLQKRFRLIIGKSEYLKCIELNGSFNCYIGILITVILLVSSLYSVAYFVSAFLFHDAAEMLFLGGATLIQISVLAFLVHEFIFSKDFQLA